MQTSDMSQPQGPCATHTNFSTSMTLIDDNSMLGPSMSAAYKLKSSGNTSAHKAEPHDIER